MADGRSKVAALKERSRRTGRPTHFDTKRKSETLIGVATDFFVEHGFSGTTIEAIAHAANMGKQAVYTRYTDKESLFNAVIQRLKDTAVFQELPPDDGATVVEGLPRRIRAILEDTANPQSMTISKLAMREGHRFPELVPLLVEGTAERYTRPLAAYLDARQKAGEVGDVDVDEIAAIAIDLILAEVSRSVSADSAPTAAHMDVCAERIARLLLNGIAAR